MKKISVQLDRTEWGQIIDGLTCRAEDYERTAHYHKTGYADDFILEASSAYEADSIAQFYRNIISKIENQISNDEH